MARLTLLLILCALATLACGSPPSPGQEPPPTTRPADAGTNITVVGDPINHYPRIHVIRIQCAGIGGPGASISFVLPAPPPDSYVQGEMLINITGSRAIAMNALQNLFEGPNNTVPARTGQLGTLQLHSFGPARRGDEDLSPVGPPVATGTLTVSGSYACP